MTHTGLHKVVAAVMSGDTTTQPATPTEGAASLAADLNAAIKDLEQNPNAEAELLRRLDL